MWAPIIISALRGRGHALHHYAVMATDMDPAAFKAGLTREELLAMLRGQSRARQHRGTLHQNDAITPPQLDMVHEEKPHEISVFAVLALGRGPGLRGRVEITLIAPGGIRPR